MKELTTNPNEGAVCTVCKEQSHRPRVRKSKLMPGMNLILCNACFDGKYEPRFAIIIQGQQPNGLELIRDYIKHHRYVGPPITIKELYTK